MRVAVLDDYQSALGDTAAIKRLGQIAEVQVLNERISSEDALVRTLRGCQTMTPHLGWPTDSGFEGFAENAVANIFYYLDGKLTRALNPEAMQRRAKLG